MLFLKSISLLIFIAVCSLDAGVIRGHFEPKKIAICIVATGKYIDFAKALIKSGERFLLPRHRVTYFVFSDTQIQSPNVIWIYQKHEKWPFSTLLRFEMYAKQKEAFETFDYIFAIDADMLCVSQVGDELLHERVATTHPGFAIPRKGVTPAFDSIAASKAYIPPSARGGVYFAGALFGGSRRAFIELIDICIQNINEDLKKGIIALYHDESHLNWYFRKYPPTKILSPSYCYTSSREKAEEWLIYGRFKPKILCLEKEHKSYRN